MDLLEYQGKEFFRRHGVATTPPGAVCSTPDQVRDAAQELGGRVVVKAQVKTGGRGKAGGVKLAADPDEARAAAQTILGLDIGGHAVELVYVEPASDIADEYYLSVMHDRVGKGYLVICSAEGGVDIEQVNRERPEAVVKQPLLPSEVADGLPRSRAQAIVRAAALPADACDPAADLLVRLVHAFIAGDALLCEVNPLVRTTHGRVIALDAKVTLDDNALFRHDEHREWVEFDQQGDDLEARAKRRGIQYVKLDGTVGVLGNGAGLVMATIDLVAQAGGAPANFLDVGGGASADTMAESLSIVLADPQVASVLINIYGGITRGEEVARGIMEALRRLGDIGPSLVVRLDGTNAEEGRRILEQAAHANVVAAADMRQAAERAVQLAAPAGAREASA
ncbi:MAG TPA: ADP-forming succinate--CoA ligase subunit beta [Nitriliruptorales bacterium]|nr:ADP-forming succinate--CoA ligase subunit beta [Nitriliruptorales bacterium]